MNWGNGRSRVPHVAMIAGSLGVVLMALVALAISLQLHSEPLDDRSPRAALPLLLVDLNSADVSELELLPMIGPSRARAIVDDRQINGPFESVDELVRVRGIGPGILARVRDFAQARPSTSGGQGLD